LGTDTGGSVRGPSSAQGLVGLKPTHGLLSRNGIVPLALTYDTGGPIARNLYDIAVSLNVMTGVDKADAATKKSEGKIAKDYTAFLKTGSLKGARIGIARDFMGKDPEIDKVVEAAIVKLKALGAICIDVKYPEAVLEAKGELSTFIMSCEFKAQITEYLKRTGPSYPKTFDDIVARSNDPGTHYRSPEKAYALKYTASKAVALDDPAYLKARDQGLAMIKAGIDGMFTKDKLDAIVYPTFPRGSWTPIIPPSDPKPPAPTDAVTSLANATGYPDLIMPAGMTKDGLPVTISFFGQAFTEKKLLGYGYDFEQATHARVLPKTTPKLPADDI
jgi:amidase